MDALVVCYVRLELLALPYEEGIHRHTKCAVAPALLPRAIDHVAAAELAAVLAAETKAARMFWSMATNVRRQGRG